MPSTVAVEFVRHVLQTNPQAKNFGDIYDALSRTACARSFYNLGHAELAQAGLSFSLLSLHQLERLVTEVQQSMPEH